MNFNHIFDTNNSNRQLNEPRDKFMSRVFGIFNEEIVRIWCKSEVSHYEDIGRPTIYDRYRTGRGSTLDFTLKDKESNKIYISEMKCEIQYENFKYLQLDSIKHLNHHNKPAYEKFLGVAATPQKYIVKVKGEETKVDGAILIWGKTEAKSIKQICESTNLTNILSLENIINNLIKIKDKCYFELLNQKQEWICHLINGLKN